MSQEKKSADYTSGTYFIHPRLIEEMRQQRQKRQLAREQGEVPSEQQPDLASQHISVPDEQAIQVAHNLTDTTGDHTKKTVHVQPTQK